MRTLWIQTMPTMNSISVEGSEMTDGGAFPQSVLHSSRMNFLVGMIGWLGMVMRPLARPWLSKIFGPRHEVSVPRTRSGRPRIIGNYSDV